MFSKVPQPKKWLAHVCVSNGKYEISVIHFDSRNLESTLNTVPSDFTVARSFESPPTDSNFFSIIHKICKWCPYLLTFLNLKIQKNKKKSIQSRI